MSSDQGASSTPTPSADPAVGTNEIKKTTRQPPGFGYQPGTGEGGASSRHPVPVAPANASIRYTVENRGQSSECVTMYQEFNKPGTYHYHSYPHRMNLKNGKPMSDDDGAVLTRRLGMAAELLTNPVLPGTPMMPENPLDFLGWGANAPGNLNFQYHGSGPSSSTFLPQQ